MFRLPSVLTVPVQFCSGPVAYNFLRRAQGIGLPLESLITHRFPLERIEEAFAGMNRRARYEFLYPGGGSELKVNELRRSVW